MANTLARIKKAGETFEIMVDMDSALKFKKGLIPTIDIQVEDIFSDVKKGERASSEDLMKAFGTDNVDEIARRIIKEGEVQTTQEHRDAEQEKRFKQAVDFIATNSVDPKTGNPHTPDRIRRALEEAHVNIKNIPIENQITNILEQISSIIPIKLETKRIKITIPAVYTGKAYGIIGQYKEDEKWKDDGSLEVIIKIPSGMIMDFYDN